MTVAYENFVLKCLINSTAKDVAEKLRSTEDIVEGIVERRIALDVDWSDYHPTARGLDEIAMKKGHKQYLTLNPTTTSIIDIITITRYAAPVDPTHHQEAAHVTHRSDRRRRMCHSYV